jgi:hypothetical protein
MSEYQYYEFQAIDRPLGEKDMAELRAISTRAVITATSFTNTYQWGDLKADPRRLLRKYFDAFLYVANWGSHRLAFRVPADAVDTDTLKAYQTPESFSIRHAGSHVVLDFCSEDEPGDWVNGEGWLASLVSLRADILRGDFRAPYLTWLLDVQHGPVEGGAEPPVPPGLAELSAPLKSLADFLRLDDDLLSAAAEASAPLPAPTPASQQQWKSWVQSLDEADKDTLLRRVASGDISVQWELQRRFQQHLDETQSSLAASRGRQRSVGDILVARDERARQRRQRQAEKKARREREAAAAREAYLKSLGQREGSVRGKISALIGTKQQKSYDQAVQLLADLRDAAGLHGRTEAFGEYLTGLRNEHVRKVSLLRRLDRAGL